jgi:hypothetical protein
LLVPLVFSSRVTIVMTRIACVRHCRQPRLNDPVTNLVESWQLQRNERDENEMEFDQIAEHK